MQQEQRWEQEYIASNPNIRALSSDKPSLSALKFIEYLDLFQVSRSNGVVLDVGCGVGRNANWLALQGFNVVGMDFAQSALSIARDRAQSLGVDVAYQHVQIGENRLPIPDECVDFVFDSMMSHLLNEDLLKKYLKDAYRVLNKDGRYILYVPDKTYDQGAKELLVSNPGPEKDTYVNLDMGIVERAHDIRSIIELYLPFNVEHMEVVNRPTAYQDKILDKYYRFAVFTK